jgi:hypothetical protein
MKLGGLTVTAINQGTVATYEAAGTRIYIPVLTPIYNTTFEEHRTKRDINDITDVATARWRLFTQGTAPITNTTQFAIGYFTTWPLPAGTMIYICDGEPAIWRSRSGVVHHIETYLREQGG